MTPITKLPPDPPIDLFLYRLLAAISAGMALLSGILAGNQAFQRIPIARSVMGDFAVSSIGRAGEALFEHPYVALVAAGIAFAAGLIAIIWPRRWLLAAAFFCSFVAAGMTVATEIVLSRVWTWLTASLTS